LIPTDLPDLSVLIDKWTPRDGRQVVGEYETSRAAYAMQANRLRDGIEEKPNAVSRAMIPIAELGLKGAFSLAEDKFKNVGAAFGSNAAQFKKDALAKAQSEISSVRASLDQYALAQSQNPPSQAEVTTQPPAPAAAEVATPPERPAPPQRRPLPPLPQPAVQSSQQEHQSSQPVLQSSQQEHQSPQPAVQSSQPEHQSSQPVLQSSQQEPQSPPPPYAEVSQDQTIINPPPRLQSLAAVQQPQRRVVAANAVAESSRGHGASVPPAPAQQRSGTPARSYPQKSSIPKKDGPKMSH
jgi:hypothetical protein